MFLKIRVQKGVVNTKHDNPNLFFSQNRFGFTVRWIVSGETISQATYFEGDVIVVPENPTQANATFKGWTPEVPETMPAQNIDFVTTWNVSAHEHEAFIAGAYAPTCTEAGYTGNTYCKSCGETISAGQPIPKLGHNYQKHESEKNGVHTITNTCTRCGHTTRSSYNENKSGKYVSLRDFLNMIFEWIFETIFKVPYKKR